MGSGSWWLLCCCLVVVFSVPFCAGVTDPRDVAAINSLYFSLGSPPLDKWIPGGGDPCGEEWQGVYCVFSNITELRLNGMNLGGVLGEGIGGFESLIVMDLSNNHIGGTIPYNLPVTVRNLSLSYNQFNGSIPTSLSSLTQLSMLSLNNNLLGEGIPDCFLPLKSLINLDMSANNLSGQLPLSFANLTSLSTLHLENNTLTGILDVLQDLPLLDLNVENNLFSGPIPAKLLAVPNFRRDGNPFNTTVLPSPPAAFPPLVARAPSPGHGSWEQAYGPSIPGSLQPENTRKFWTSVRIIWISVAGSLLVILLGVWLMVYRHCKNRLAGKSSEKHDMGAHRSSGEKPDTNSMPSFPADSHMEKVPREAILKPADGYVLDSGRIGKSLKTQDEKAIDAMPMPPSAKLKKQHEIDMYSVPHQPAELNISDHSSENLIRSCSVNAFTIALLQQYTNSFSEENFIGEGILGSVYRAELPDGKLLAVRKLNSKSFRWHTDDEFLEMLGGISKLKHPNIVELLGYCNEHGQKLLVYEHCGNGTLYDALHANNETHKKLSWNARVKAALGAARALQYLHEVCLPSIIHQNFKSTNILLDDRLGVHVSDCGLASLLTSDSASQLSEQLIAHGYSTPEFESGGYTCQSDVYSLGVVMLELLTGRKSFDRSRPRFEQSLVRWAIPRLHDIDALSRMVDPSLEGAYPMKSLSRFADVISRCVQWEPGFRPPISEIVQDLLHMI